jgi:hypothetical protein
MQGAHSGSAPPARRGWCSFVRPGRRNSPSCTRGTRRRAPVSGRRWPSASGGSPSVLRRPTTPRFARAPSRSSNAFPRRPAASQRCAGWRASLRPTHRPAHDSAPRSRWGPTRWPSANRAGTARHSTKGAFISIGGREKPGATTRPCAHLRARWAGTVPASRSQVRSCWLALPTPPAGAAPAPRTCTADPWRCIAFGMASGAPSASSHHRSRGTASVPPSRWTPPQAWRWSGPAPTPAPHPTVAERGCSTWPPARCGHSTSERCRKAKAQALELRWLAKSPSSA